MYIFEKCLTCKVGRGIFNCANDTCGLKPLRFGMGMPRLLSGFFIAGFMAANPYGVIPAKVDIPFCIGFGNLGIVPPTRSG